MIWPKPRGRPEKDLMEEYFPLQDPHPAQLSASVPAADAADGGRNVLTAMSVAGEDAKTLRPGEAYAIYSAHDILGILPDDFAMVVGWAARWAGVSSDDLCAAVEKFERRLDRFWLRRRRPEAADGQGTPGETVVDAEDDDEQSS